MGQPADTCSIWKLQPQLPHVKRMQRRLRRRQCSRSNSGIAFGHESRMDDELRTSLWQIRREPRSGSRPGQGVNNASRVTHGEQKTLPVETLVRSRLLSMTLKQLELRCSSNTVHFVLNEENSKDALLNSNEVWQLLGRTPRFIPTLKRVDVADIARDCDIFGYRLIKAFNRFACRKYIQHAKNQSIEAGILPLKPKQFQHHPDFYAKCNRKYLDVTKPLEYIWKTNVAPCPRLQEYTPSVRSASASATADSLPDAYLQKIVTAMATSFSVTYATIFMIWLCFQEVVGAKSNEQGRQLFLPCTMDASSPAQMHLVLCCCRNVWTSGAKGCRVRLMAAISFRSEPSLRRGALKDWEPFSDGDMDWAAGEGLPKL